MTPDEEKELLRTLGGRVKWARVKRGLSQQVLADKAKVVQSTIGNIESGKRQKPRELLSIAQTLQVNALWLESGKGTWNDPAAPAPAVSLAPEYMALIRDLEDLPPRKRSGYIDMIRQAAEDAREAAQHLGEREKAHTSQPSKQRASVTLGDGNEKQRVLPLLTATDPFTAAPGERESALYRRIEDAPKKR